MRHNWKRWFGIMFTLALVLGLVPGMSLTAYADLDPVSYMAWNGSAVVDAEGGCTSYTVLTNQTTWTNGTWYVLKESKTISSRITVNGTVNLILCDGATLTASKGIAVATGKTLNIYEGWIGERATTPTVGALTASGSDNYNSGIGSNANVNSGTINIHGGQITAKGGGAGAGIGAGGAASGKHTDDGTLNIYGGTVKATGGGNAAGIGGGQRYSCGSVNIYGGAVTTTGGATGASTWGGAGIGGGSYGNGGTVAIYGGTVNANSGGGGSMGIGKGEDGSSNGTLTLGQGVKLETSANNSTWTNTTSTPNTRTRYMRTSFVHPHSFTYSVGIGDNANTITAECGGAGTCGITEGLTLTISAPTGSLVYDGTTTYPATLSTGYNTTAFPDTYTISYTKDGSAYDGAPKDAGTYTASVTAGTGDAAKTASVSYTVTKATSQSVTPSAQSRTSDGSAQPLVKPGSVDYGTLFYALGSNDTTAPTDGWSTEVPTATSAGTYYVWYKVVGDANHNDVDPACVVVTIGEAAKSATTTIAAPAASTSDYTLLASLKTSGKKALKMGWTAVPGAEGYDVFFGMCNKGDCQLLASVNGTSYKIKGLKKGFAYKAYVRAWKNEGGAKVYIGEPSPDVHAITNGKSNRYTNPKKISVKKKKLTVGVGKTKAIKAKLKKFSDSRNYLNHVSAKVRYYSSDRTVATVSANGRVTGVGPGKCTVFAVAENGLRVGVKVTVK